MKRKVAINGNSGNDEEIVIPPENSDKYYKVEHHEMSKLLKVSFCEKKNVLKKMIY